MNTTATTLIGVVFAPGDSQSTEPGPGALTTFNQPPVIGDVAVSSSSARTPAGIVAVFDGGGSVYTLPLPEDAGQVAYRGAPKQQYVWRSKKFVMPGQTTMGAAKVVHDGHGVRFQLHMDNCCVFETVVRDCDPFRLPSQLRGLMWEIVLIGCARVTSVTVASTPRELSDD